MRLSGGRYTCLLCGALFVVPERVEARAVFVKDDPDRPIERIVLIEDVHVHRCFLPDATD
jgi:hypothetical protein